MFDLRRPLLALVFVVAAAAMAQAQEHPDHGGADRPDHQAGGPNQQQGQPGAPAHQGEAHQEQNGGGVLALLPGDSVTEHSIDLPSGKLAYTATAGTLPTRSFTVWSPFPANTDYFSPSTREFMFNLIVDDLDGALGQVHLGGAQVVGEVEEHEYGRFGWFIDPEGNKVELWQPSPSTGDR